MKNVVEKVQQLMMLATSSNEHEARSAALLAVQLIKKHKIQLHLPATPATPAGGTSRARTKSDPNYPADPPKRSRSSGRGKKAVADPPEKIVAPLGGDCVECGGRYRADSPIYWFNSGGGMHVRCYEDWAKRR